MQLQKNKRNVTLSHASLWVQMWNSLLCTCGEVGFPCDQMNFFFFFLWNNFSCQCNLSCASSFSRIFVLVLRYTGFINSFILPMINTVHCWLCKQLAALSGAESKGLTHRDENTNKNVIYNSVADHSMARKVLSALKNTCHSGLSKGFLQAF